MKIATLAVALTALLFGTALVPTQAMADPPSWAPAHGWRKQKNVDKRAERTERREERALRLRDSDATTTDLNRSQITKLDRQNRREALAEARRDQIRRENRALRRQQALRP